MNKQVDELLQRKMDRKNFLKHVALGVVMMTGAASLVKTFQSENKPPQPQANRNNALAYGGSAYGGVKRPS